MVHAERPSSTLRGGRRGWVAAALGLLLIYGAIHDLVNPTPEQSRSWVRIGDPTGDGLLKRPFGAADARAIASHLPHDVEGFKRALEDARGAVNLTLWAQTAAKRTAWMRPVETAINWAAMVFLLLLLGPVAVYLRAPREARSGRDAWRSVPYFVVAAAGSMLVVNGLASAVIEIQGLQIVAASFGALDVSLTDATIQYVVDDVAATRVLIDGLLAPGFTEDPLAVMTFYQSAWSEVAQLGDSKLVHAASGIVGGLAWLVDLYGPLLALLVLGVLGRVGVPLVRRLLGYPRDVLAGECTETPGTFLWSQARRVFGEVRIALWLLLFILLLTALAVVFVRVAALPTAWMALQALASAVLDMRGGGELPELVLLSSAMSLGLYLVVAASACLLPVGLIVGKAHVMLRARSEDKRRFRDFPSFWRTARDLLVRVTLPAVLAAALVFLVVFGLAAWLGVGAHGWLSVLPAPLMGLALWQLGTVSTVRELARRDVSHGDGGR